MKIYFIESENGTLFSADKKRRFIRLIGKEAFLYLNSDEGKKKRFFKTESENDGGDEIFIEIPPTKIRDARKPERREQYVNDCKKESDIETIYISDIEVDDGITGEELIASQDESVDTLAIRSLDLKTLKKALSTLSEKEYEVIEKMFLVPNPMTERELAALLNVSQPAVHKRKNSAFKKIKNFFKKN